MSAASDKLADARQVLAGIRVRIQSYSYGDRPQSPPAELLREERRVLAVVAWWEAEVKRAAGVIPGAMGATERDPK